MRKLWPWILGLTVVLLVGTVVLFGFGLLRSRQMPMFWQDYGERQWRDFGMPHHGLRGLPVMGIFGLLLMLILPLGLLGLLVIGIVLLVRALQKPGQAVDRHRVDHCPNCGKEVESDWTICPYCGENLGGEA